ncbi:MAG TPA: tetratricopeptide repeat protein [Gaiellaceae bacterium]|jgi:tetratricopeptide (TPR) repeat protein|nr:tetratricopeptide repeat protein [Gaiellaceae bacterium]
MARAAVKAKQAARQAQQAKAPSPKPRARGRRKHASGGNPNQQLFFVRMRRSAKPMYFILALLFAATFAFLGVGSGSSGLSQLFNNINIFGGSGTSVSKALKQVQKHPNSPKAFRDLATAYETKGDTTGAIGALENYTNLKKKDAAAFSELAGLQMTSAGDYVTQYENAYASEQLAAPSQALLPSPTSTVGKALGTNPIEQAAATQVNSTVSTLGEKAQLAYAQAIASYQRVATLEPNDANAQFELAQAAQTAGDTTTAVSAYKAYLKLNPNGTTAAEVRSLIKQLTKK